MPKLRTTLFLLLACLACGVLLWVLDRPTMRFSRPTATQTGNLFPAPLRDVDYLMIERNGFRAELRREADGWVMTHPVVAYANQTVVQRLLDRCERAPLNTRLDAHALKLRGLTLADFGLLEPQARLVVSGPRARAELLLGNPTSTSNELFCSFMQTDAVLLTDLSLLDTLPVSLFALSDSSFFRGDARRVAAIGLRRPGLPFLKVVRDAGGWNLSQPITARADSATVAALLEALTTTKIARFVWPEGDRLAEASTGLGTSLLRFGLDDATDTQIQVWMAGDPIAQRFLLGRAVDGMPGYVHALAADSVAVVAVSNALLEAAMLPVEAFRDKRLFAQTADEFRSLAVQGVATPFSLRRDVGGAWELTSPVSEAAEAAGVARLLDALLRLRAVGFASPDPLDGETGTKVRIDLTFGQSACRLLAAEDAAGRAPTVRIAFTNDATVYLVPTSQWAEVVGWLTHPVAFRNRTLFTLPADGIRRLAVQRADGTVEAIEHERGANVWRSVAPDRSVNRVALDAWLAVLAHLRADRVEKTLDAAVGTAPYGLDRPHLEIAIDLTAEDALRRVLTIGARTPDDGRFAVVKGHDAVFVLGAAVWRQLDPLLLNPVEQPVPAVGVTLPPFLETL